MDSREPHPSGWGEIREPSSWRDTGHWRDSRDWSDTREWRDASEELELLESIHMVNAMKRPSYCFSQAMTASAVEFVEFIDNDPFAKAPLEHPLRQARSFSN